MHCQHTQMPGSRFEDVDLARSVFDDVNLQDARFSNANMAGAVFNNLTLADARIDDAKLDGLRIDGVLVTDLQAAWAAQQAAAKPAAVIYAKHLATLRRFYQAATGLVLAHEADDHVVLASPAFELVLVAMPTAIANTVHIASPPVRREDTPIKLVFAVDSLARLRVLVAGLGGELNPPGREWEFNGQRICDGHDPEGNVLQFRQRAGQVSA